MILFIVIIFQRQIYLFIPEWEMALAGSMLQVARPFNPQPSFLNPFFFPFLQYFSTFAGLFIIRRKKHCSS